MHPYQPPPPDPGQQPWRQPPYPPVAPPQYRPAWQQPAAPYVIPPRQFNHGKHVVADVLTFGLWLPFHLLCWAVHPRRPVVVYPDGRRVKQ